ncbi:MAG: response regulator transcription factor [Planctomycetota bacterium]
MRVLIVEDDQELAAILRRGFEEELWSVAVAHDGAAGRHLALTEDFDLIILDLMLPVIDGVAICSQLRARKRQTPVIMLTARDTIDDRVLGLDAGADDYLVKPFSISELFARIRALMRRVANRTSATLRVGSLTLDPATDFVNFNDRRITLTAREFALMQFFMQNPERVLSRTVILEKVWDSNYEGLSNVVDVYVKTLRQKLEADGEDRLIETIRGRGYRLAESRA